MKKFILYVLPVLLLISINGLSQTEIPKDSIRNKLIIAARELIASSGNCALITQDKDGLSRVRVMDPFLPEEDFAIWFGTNPKSRKVEQIKKDSRVTLYYFDSEAAGYVMIHGIAKIVEDPAEKQLRWKDEWKPFYPNKLEGYLLIKVSPLKMEVVSYAHNILGDPETWEPPFVLFN